jgi:hypothetical protein
MNKLTVKVLNKELECNVGLGFLGELSEVLELSWGEILEKYDKNPFRYVPLIMFHSMNYKPSLTGKSLDFDFSEFIDWLDENNGVGNKELVSFSQFFLKSISNNTPNEESNDGEESKKK